MPGMNLGPCNGSSVIDSAIYSESMLATPYVSLKLSEDLSAGATKYHEDFVKCEDIQSANIIRDCMKRLWSQVIFLVEGVIVN